MGVGANIDIIVASAKAYLSAISRKDEWDETFPKYDGVTLDQALSMYYDSYYKKCSYYEKRYPNHFKVFDIDSLNTVVGVNSILNFVDVKNKKVLTGITKNVTNENSE